MTTTGTRESRDSTTQRRTLARVTGAAGLITLVVVLGASLIDDYRGASFKRDADEAVSFFRSLDEPLGVFSSFATVVGLIAMLWFSIGLALLLRRYEALLGPHRAGKTPTLRLLPGPVASSSGTATICSLRHDELPDPVAAHATRITALAFALPGRMSRAMSTLLRLPPLVRGLVRLTP